MTKYTWVYVVLAVVVALIANSVSTVWASKESRFNIWLIVLLIISPLVFITFGIVTAKFGLAVTSATIDSILTISSILVGLFLFGGMSNMLPVQWVGITLAVAGIILIHLK